MYVLAFPVIQYVDVLLYGYFKIIGIHEKTRALTEQTRYHLVHVVVVSYATEIFMIARCISETFTNVPKLGHYIILI